MKSKFVWWFAVFAWACAGLWPGGGPSSTATKLVWGEPSGGLRASIDVPYPRLSSSHAIVAVAVLNTIGEPVVLQTIPAFVLNDMEYWCPVDLAGGGGSLAANERVELTIESGSSFIAQIDLAKLNCEPGFSSFWPENPFFEEITGGQYALRLDIEVIDGAESFRISSNTVSVEIAE